MQFLFCDVVFLVILILYVFFYVDYCCVDGYMVGIGLFFNGVDNWGYVSVFVSILCYLRIDFLNCCWIEVCDWKQVFLLCFLVFMVFSG